MATRGFAGSLRSAILRLGLVFVCGAAGMVASQDTAALPSVPLQFGFFAARFAPDGAFTLEGQGWPTFTGTWTTGAGEVTLVTPGIPEGCAAPGRYRFEVNGTRVTFHLAADDCKRRRMILDGSLWRPRGESERPPERRIVRTAPGQSPPLTAAGSDKGSWPAFRGRDASGVAEGQHLPDRWDGKSGDNIRWRAAIPGLAHSSPIVWGDRIFVTSVVSSNPNATFRPGLYGDGDASEDRSRQRWMLYAVDAPTGRIEWERVAHEGTPLEKRHIKSAYASATPATAGRIVVAWFGSHGVHAFDMLGNVRTGRELWRLGGSSKITAPTPIANGLFVVGSGRGPERPIFAVRPNGAVVWSHTGRGPYMPTPLVYNGIVYVLGNNGVFDAYDLQAGTEIYRQRLPHLGSGFSASPVAADGRIYLANGLGGHFKTGN